MPWKLWWGNLSASRSVHLRSEERTFSYLFSSRMGGPSTQSGSFYFFFWCNSPTRVRATSSMRFQITHSVTPHSVELLWTKDRPVAEISTWRHTTLTRDIHVPGGILFLFSYPLFALYRYLFLRLDSPEFCLLSLLYNTQHKLHAPGGIQTSNLNTRSAADPRFLDLSVIAIGSRRFRGKKYTFLLPGSTICPLSSLRQCIHNTDYPSRKRKKEIRTRMCVKMLRKKEILREIGKRTILKWIVLNAVVMIVLSLSDNLILESAGVKRQPVRREAQRIPLQTFRVRLKNIMIKPAEQCSFF
jgi:hypothetical protein